MAVHLFRDLGAYPPVIEMANLTKKGFLCNLKTFMQKDT
jgi:hypothetical protein